MEEISRRTALKAAAWSAPVVALAVAAPAASASDVNVSGEYSISSFTAGWIPANSRFQIEAYVLFHDAAAPVGTSIVFTLDPHGANITYPTTVIFDNGYAIVQLPESSVSPTLLAKSAEATSGDAVAFTVIYGPVPG